MNNTKFATIGFATIFLVIMQTQTVLALGWMSSGLIVPKSCFVSEKVGGWTYGTVAFKKNGVPFYSFVASHPETGLTLKAVMDTSASTAEEAIKFGIEVSPDPYMGKINLLFEARDAYSDSRKWAMVSLSFFLNKTGTGGSTGDAVKDFYGVADRHMSTMGTSSLFFPKQREFIQYLKAVSLNDEMWMWYRAIGKNGEILELTDRQKIQTDGIGDRIFQDFDEVVKLVDKGEFMPNCDADAS